MGRRGCQVAVPTQPLLCKAFVSAAVPSGLKGDRARAQEPFSRDPSFPRLSPGPQLSARLARPFPPPAPAPSRLSARSGLVASSPGNGTQAAFVRLLYDKRQLVLPSLFQRPRRRRCRRAGAARPGGPRSAAAKPRARQKCRRCRNLLHLSYNHKLHQETSDPF